MNITVSQAQGRAPVAIIQPHGDVDASSYQELITIAQKLYRTGAQDILLDLSDVPYMSSSGLVALNTIARIVRGEKLPESESGWEAFRAIDRDRDRGIQPHFKLLSPQARVNRVLEMAGMKQYLEVYSDLETAVASF